MKTETIMMCAWVKVDWKHGVIAYEPIWLEQGQEPREGDIVDAKKFRRAPNLDTAVQVDRVQK